MSNPRVTSCIICGSLMTLRDHFAALALQGMLAGCNGSEPCTHDLRSPDAEAEMAYAFADAMLRARELEPQR